MDNDNEPLVFSVTSGYGYHTRQPYVGVAVPGFEIKMPPNDARALALNLLQAAEAALSDAFMVEFIQHIGGDEKDAFVTLTEWREWRQGRDVLPGSEESPHA